MQYTILTDPRFLPLSSAALKPAPEARWALATLRGRIVELSAARAPATLTLAIEMVREAQLAGEPAAWLTDPGSCFFPADVADNGVDLAALPVVRAPGVHAMARAADRLLRSGAFGLVVADLASAREAPRVPDPLLGRLAGLAQKHDTALVFLTRKSREAPSLSSLVSLRGEVVRRRDDRGLACVLRVLKDKRRGPGWMHEEARRL